QRGLIEEQKARIRPYYKAKRDVMVGALAEEALPGVTWVKPAGGMFVWVSLPEGMDAEKLLPLAVEEGVAYVAGSPFFVDGSGANTVRLNFSKEDPDKLREGVRRLARAIRAMAARDVEVEHAR
ncbi:MAG TPA: aminotransferase class I/II-fold pyridoxal phosphate-dependent enzyme, partial [Vicinamibacteria bacterium]